MARFTRDAPAWGERTTPMGRKLAVTIGAATATAFLLVACAGRPSPQTDTAQATEQPTPAPVDPVTARANQLYWCSGFYSEIERQAVNSNNALLHEKAQRNLEHYAHEMIFNAAAAQSDPQQFAPASNAGSQGAGRVLWDFFPKDRAKVLAIRRPREDACDRIAVESSAYDAAFEKWLLSFGHKPQ